MLAQVDLPPSSPPWYWIVAILLGSGGIVTTGLIPVIRTYVEARRVAAEARDREEREQRKARHEAEVEQIRTITAMAGAVPELTREIREDRARQDAAVAQIVNVFTKGLADMRDSLRDSLSTATRSVDANTRAVDALLAEEVAKRDDMLRTIAEKAGVDSKREGSRPAITRQALGG